MTALIQVVRRSLFVRLLFIFGITITLFFAIFSISLSTISQNNNTIDAIPDFFARNIESIIEDIGTPPNLNNAIRLAEELDWSIAINNPIMRWSSDNEYRLPVEESVLNRILTPDAEVRSINNEDIIMVQRDGYDFYLYKRSLSNNNPNYVVLYIGVALASVVLFLNYFMVNKLLDPVRLLRKGAERIRLGDLSFRVKSNRQDELGELTDSINHMADSLQSMLEAKRQLLLAISHELRTPITKAKLRLEFMPDSHEKDQLKEDIQEIELLISDLIEAERLNEEHAVLTAEPTPIAAFVEGVCEQFKSYSGGVELELPVEDHEVVLDNLRVRLLITNLVNNAIRHGEGKPITVRVAFDSDFVHLEVEDSGEGIAEEHLSQISEPFYRVDSSRQRNTGGFGLGLYLCRLIVQAHGGELIIQSQLGEGTYIKVKLPPHPPLQLPIE